MNRNFFAVIHAIIIDCSQIANTHSQTLPTDFGPDLVNDLPIIKTSVELTAWIEDWSSPNGESGFHSLGNSRYLYIGVVATVLLRKQNPLYKQQWWWSGEQLHSGPQCLFSRARSK